MEPGYGYDRGINGVHNYEKLPSTERDSAICSKMWNWQPKCESSCLKYARESTIHGVKYIAQPQRHILERITWILLVLASIGASSYLSYQAVEKYYESPVIVSFQPSQTSVSQVPFPAVTVCNVNRFRKSAFENALQVVKNKSDAITSDMKQRALLLLRGLNHVCGGTSSFSTRFKYSLNETTVNIGDRGFLNGQLDSKITVGQHKQNANELEKSVQLCHQMIKLCLWKGVEHNCTEMFIPLITDYGYCCSFNMYPRKLLLKLSDEDSRYTKYERLIPKEVMDTWAKLNMDTNLISSFNMNKAPEELDYPRHQNKAGLPSGLSFVLNPELDEYFCGGHDGFGFRVSTHSPINYPQINDFGLAVPPNAEVLISTQPEITVSDPNIQGLDVEKRFCYFVHESPLEFYSQYTLSNCILECIAKAIIKTCKCIRYDLPYSLSKEKLAYCEGKAAECAVTVRQKIDQEGTKRNCPHCKPSCNQLEYRSQTSSMPIRTDTDVWIKDAKSAEWKNMSIVHVFFGSDTVYSRVRKNLYGFNELFAHVGGILGLFLGVSIISLVEPFYFMIRFITDPRFKKADTSVESAERRLKSYYSSPTLGTASRGFDLNVTR